MSAIIQQLQLDQTYFIQLGLIAFLFLILSQLYFKPFLALFEKRHQRTAEDSKKADEILAEVKQQLTAYDAKLSDARALAKQDYEQFILEVKKQESQLLSQARGEAKQIVQQAQEDLEKSKQQVKSQLQAEVDGFAKKVADSLL